jgi:hypothetical protein
MSDYSVHARRTRAERAFAPRIGALAPKRLGVMPFAAPALLRLFGSIGRLRPLRGRMVRMMEARNATK